MRNYTGPMLRVTADTYPRRDLGFGSSRVLDVAFEEAGYDPTVCAFDSLLEYLPAMMRGDKRRVSIYLWGELVARWVGELGSDTGSYRDFHRRVRL